MVFTGSAWISALDMIWTVCPSFIKGWSAKRFSVICNVVKFNVSFARNWALAIKDPNISMEEAIDFNLKLLMCSIFSTNLIHSYFRSLNFRHEQNNQICSRWSCIILYQLWICHRALGNRYCHAYTNGYSCFCLHAKHKNDDGILLFPTSKNRESQEMVR